MMGISTETDKILRDYIEEQRGQDIKGSLDRIRDHLMAHDAEDKGRHAELRGDIRGLSLRVGVLEKDLDGLEDQAEATGRFELESLRDESKWWRRGVLGGIGAALVAFMTWLVQRGFK